MDGAPSGKPRGIKAEFFRSQPSLPTPPKQLRLRRLDALRASEGFSLPSSSQQAAEYSAKENKHSVIQKVVELPEQKIQDVEKSIQQALQDAREAPSAMESWSDSSRSEKQRLASNFEGTKQSFAHTIKFLQKSDITRTRTTIQNGSLIEVCENKSCTWYFILPFGGGDRFVINNLEIMTLSPESPLGKLFLNKKKSNTITLQTPKGTRVIKITSIC